MAEEFVRGEIHIFADDPSVYIPLIDEQIVLLITYDEVSRAIQEDRKKIYTTELMFLSHLWIKAGWDIILYDNKYVIKFDDNYIDLIGARNTPMSYYYMLELYRSGDLYQTSD